LDEAVDARNTEALVSSMQYTDAYLKRLEDVSVFEMPESELFRVANGSYPHTVTCIKEGKDAVFGALYSKDGVLRAVSNLQEKRLIAQIHPYTGGKQYETI
jgi:hypothetical protein